MKVKAVNKLPSEGQFITVWNDDTLGLVAITVRVVDGIYEQYVGLVDGEHTWEAIDTGWDPELVTYMVEDNRYALH